LSLDKDTYKISFRAVRFKVKCDTFVTVVTNLSREEFPADDILYYKLLEAGFQSAFIVMHKFFISILSKWNMADLEMFCLPPHLTYYYLYTDGGSLS
jgi:hypothetical protein